MNDKQKIQFKLDELRNQNNIIKRFYHFRSIQNFLYYFDDIESGQLKEKVYSILIEYLDLVKSEPIEDIHQCIILFDEYIRPVGTLYENAFKFMPVISLWVLIFWAIVLSAILYMFNLSMGFYFVIGILFFGYFFYFLKKKWGKRVYGLKW